MASDNTLLRVETVAELLKISRGRAYAMAASGELPAIRIGRSIRVRASELAAWLEKRSCDLALETGQASNESDKTTGGAE